MPAIYVCDLCGKQAAAFTLTFGRRADKEILGNLNFRWPEFSADPIALSPREDVAALDHHDLAHFDGSLHEEPTPFNGA